MSYNPSFTQKKTGNNVLATIICTKSMPENNTETKEHYVQVIKYDNNYCVGYTCFHNADCITMEQASSHCDYKAALEAAYSIALSAE